VSLGTAGQEEMFQLQGHYSDNYKQPLPVGHLSV